MKNLIIFRLLLTVIFCGFIMLIGIIGCKVKGNDEKVLSLKVTGKKTYNKFLSLMKAPIMEEACGYFYINIDSSMENNDDNFNKLPTLNFKFYDFEKKLEVKGALKNSLLHKKILAVFYGKIKNGSGIFTSQLEYHKNKSPLLAYHYNNFSIDNKYSLNGAIYFENENISEQNTSTKNGIFRINGSLNLLLNDTYKATLEIKNLFIDNSNNQCGLMDSVNMSNEAQNLILLTYKYSIMEYKSIASSKTIQITPDNEHQEMFPLLLL